MTDMRRIGLGQLSRQGAVEVEAGTAKNKWHALQGTEEYAQVATLMRGGNQQPLAVTS